MSYDRNAGKYDRKPRYQDVLGERVFVQSPKEGPTLASGHRRAGLLPSWIEKRRGVHVDKDGAPLFYHGVQIHPDGQPIEWYSPGPMKVEAWLDRMRKLYTYGPVSKAMLDGMKLEYVMCQDGFEKMEEDLGETRDRWGNKVGPTYRNEGDRLAMLFKGIPVIWEPEIPFAHIYLRERKVESKVRLQGEGQTAGPWYPEEKHEKTLWDRHGVHFYQPMARLATQLVVAVCKGCGGMMGPHEDGVGEGPRHYRNIEGQAEICGAWEYLVSEVSLQDEIELGAGNRGIKRLDLVQAKLDILLRRAKDKGTEYRKAQLEKDVARFGTHLRRAPENAGILGLAGIPKSFGVLEGFTT